MGKVLIALALVLGVSTFAFCDINYQCLKCHGYSGFQTEEHKLWVGQSAFEISQHRELGCTDCHKGEVTWPHDKGVEIRCDLACHAKGKDHKAVVEAEASSAHTKFAISSGAGLSCVICHDGAPAPNRAEAEALCRGCHPGVDKVRGVFPDTPGAFGEKAHSQAAGWANIPGCLDCHGSHGIVSGAEARKACFGGGCHEGNDESFAALFDHGKGSQSTPTTNEGNGLWLVVAAAVGLFGLLHSVRG